MEALVDELALLKLKSNPKQDDAKKATETDNLRPMAWPADVLCMIFTEFLSKPGMHFAKLDLRPTASGYTLHLKPWSAQDLESSYRSSLVLSATCKLARDCLHRATVEPSTIAYDNGTVKIDAATDLICFCLPEKWSPELFLLPRGNFFPRFNDLGNEAKLGSLRRAGVQVTKRMWRQVLFHLFNPEILDDSEYKIHDGRLHKNHLAAIMISFYKLEAFYLVVTDIDAADWKDYYQKFPVAFHDHTGSYVEVREAPVHSSVIERLWEPENLDYPSDWPYTREYKPNANWFFAFPEGVDSQMTSRQRVKLLLGLLESARRVADRKKDMKNVRFGILARKPGSAGKPAPSKTSTPPSTTTTPNTDEYTEFVNEEGQVVDRIPHFRFHSMEEMMHEDNDRRVQESKYVKRMVEELDCTP